MQTAELLRAVVCVQRRARGVRDRLRVRRMRRVLQAESAAWAALTDCLRAKMEAGGVAGEPAFARKGGAENGAKYGVNCDLECGSEYNSTCGASAACCNGLGGNTTAESSRGSEGSLSSALLALMQMLGAMWRMAEPAQHRRLS
eukprot:1265472-Pleurochrysis_carterae.AAC.1